MQYRKKIDLIFMHYQKDWTIYKKTTKVRNEMIHFKKNFIGHGGNLSDFKLGKESVAQFLTKKTCMI